MVGGRQSIVLGGGCFWCLHAGYRLINGVVDVQSGYAGGESSSPDYYKVATGRTGHAEVVKVTFDPTIVSLQDILDIFWTMHNPTTVNQQGADVGTQYRSIILYTNQQQKPVIDTSLEEVTRLWDEPIVTEVKRLDTFYPAEEEHQNYFQKQPGAGYCQVIINPKLAKLRQKFTDKLKTE